MTFGNLSNIQWARSYRDQGGCWQGKITLKDMPASEMMNKFQNWLFYDIEERVAGKSTWRGFIAQMDLGLNGIVRRVSWSEMFNSILTLTVSANNVQIKGDVFDNQDSINRYGRKELYFSSNTFGEDPANAIAEVKLSEVADPNIAQVVGNTSEDFLAIYVLGYVFTCNNRHVESNPAVKAVSSAIFDIVNENCEFVNPVFFEPNFLELNLDLGIEQRAYDLVIELTKASPVADRVPFQFFVDENRSAIYKKLPNDPLYSYREGQFYDLAGGKPISPLLLRPGVARDFSWPIKTAIPGSWLQDSRDFYVGEIEASEDKFSWRSGSNYPFTEVIATYDNINVVPEIEEVIEEVIE